MEFLVGKKSMFASKIGKNFMITPRGQKKRIRLGFIYYKG